MHKVQLKLWMVMGLQTVLYSTLYLYRGHFATSPSSDVYPRRGLHDNVSPYEHDNADLVYPLTYPSPESNPLFI